MAISTRRLRADLDKEAVRAKWSGELTPVFVLLWIVSVVRVVAAVARRETFGVIPTMALVSIVLLPWLLPRESSD
ncbi:MAG TPA: hypothetical protein VHU80_02765 [Polyangiaceae bacterium]|jgi:hypothetical protein|nr:hypothetical protein [Polyangiaceae bacterium]